MLLLFFFSSRRRHTRFSRDWSSDVCSSDLQRVLRRAAYVSVVQPTDLRNGHDLAVARRRDQLRDGGIFAERQVPPRFQIVLDISVQDAAQPAFIPDDDVIEAFAADGTDQTLRVGVLPR